MALAKQFGWDNPFTQFVDGNRNTLMGFGAGLASGRNLGQGVAAGLDRAQTGRVADDAYAAQQKQDAEAAALKDKYVQFFTQQNQPQYAQAVADGIMAPGAAYGDWMKAQGVGQGAPKPIEVGGVLLDPTTYQPIFDSRKPDAGPAAPAGYRYQPDGTMAFIPGGPADPSTAGKTTEATRRNQQLAKVIEPEAAALLGNPATGQPGTFDALANTGNQGWNAVGLGNIAASPEYQQAQNSLKTIIASYLYSVSGATANPGEVENQAAILTPKPGESAQSVADKKARIAVMVQAVQEAATGASMAPQVGGQGNAGDGWEVIGVQ